MDFSITKENIMIQYCKYIPKVPSKDCQIPGTLNLEKDKHKLYDIIPTYNIKKTYQDSSGEELFYYRRADGESLPNIKNFLYETSAKKQDSAILFQRIAQIGELVNTKYPESLKTNLNYKEPSTDANGIINEFTVHKYQPDISNFSFSLSYRYAIYF